VKLDAATINELTDERGALLKTYQEEIAMLKKKLEEMASRPAQVIVQQVGPEDDDDDEEVEMEDQEAMLRMIDEMDRYIMKADEDKTKEVGAKLAGKIIKNWRQSVRRNSVGPLPHEGGDQEKGDDAEYVPFAETLNTSVGEGDLVPAHDSGIFHRTWSCSSFNIQYVIIMLFIEATLDHFRKKSTYDNTTHMDTALLGVAKMLQGLKQQVSEKRERR
jgi:hypothetical protein